MREPSVIRWLCALAIATTIPTWAVAQEGGTVTGRVVDQSSQQPIVGATVTVAGTTLGALTGDDGRFRIANVPTGRQDVRARFIGFSASSQPVTIVAGQETTVNFALQASAVQLDAVVVNAITGQEQRLREVGANVTNIGVAELNQGPIRNVGDVLTGRAPGVTLQSTAGSVGTSQRIRIRGANSLSLSNEPLIYVDGVQVSNSKGFAIGIGGQQPARLNDLNPSDIENIEVLKGPAASALYGTAAANGVLLITTKRGRTGRARWNAYTEAGQIEDRTDYPANYLSYQLNDPSAPLFTSAGNLNTTARRPCFNYQAATGACRQDSLFVFNTLTDPRTTPFSIGSRQKYGLNVAGGGDALTYYLSGDIEDERGVISYNTMDKVSLRANVGAQVTPSLNVSLSSGYINSKAVFNNNDNSIFSPLINGIIGGAVFFPPDEEGNRDFRNYGFFFTPEELAVYPAPQDVDRFTIGMNSNYQPLLWLRANVNFGLDYINRHDHVTLQPNRLPIAESYTIGHRLSNRSNTYLYTGNGSAAATFNLTPNVVSTSTLGGSYQRTLFQNTQCFGAGIVEGTASCGGTVRLFSVDEDFSEVITVGGFFQQEIALADRLFLAAAVRGDDNSAFGSDFGLIFYPSFSASWVVAEEPWFPQYNWLNNLRLRGAVGTSGLRPDFRDAITFSNPVAVTRSDISVAGLTLGNTGNPDLRPERTTEYELGFDLGVVDNRFAIDFTYFNKRSRDALISRRLAPSFGLTASVFENLGSIRNSGTELGANFQVLNLDNLRLDLRLAQTTISNEIEELGEGIAPIIFNRGTQRHQQGYPAGAYFARPFTFNDANDDGLIASTEIEFTSDTAVFVGYSMPRHTRSLTLDVTAFRYITISTLFEQRGGHYQLNDTESFRCLTGISRGDRGCAAANDPSAPLEDQARFIAYGFFGNVYGYIEEADFVKWREIAVTLGVPPTLSDRLGVLRGASLTFSGRNLATWTDYSGLDPELNESGGAANFNQGEFNTQPPVRYLSARLNLTF